MVTSSARSSLSDATGIDGLAGGGGGSINNGTNQTNTAEYPLLDCDRPGLNQTV